jgi:hypothetical protein
MCALVAKAMDLPKPPPGFSWQEIPELKAAFLKPDGWSFKREEGKGTLAYFITKQDISKGGEFQTGLTVNVFHLKTDSAADRAQALIAQMADQHHVRSTAYQAGPFLEFACDLKDTDATGTIVMHALTIANPKTNTMYLFIFESPEADWDAAWKIGEQMILTLAIDDTE